MIIIIPQCLISHVKFIMKRKGKVVVEKLVMFGKPIRKHPTSKAKDVQKMLQWITMEPTKYKCAR